MGFFIISFIDRVAFTLIIWAVFAVTAIQMREKRNLIDFFCCFCITNNKKRLKKNSLLLFS